MALTSNQTAILTSRAGAGRFGACRFGFTPKDTRAADVSIGGNKFFYLWSRVYLPSTSWTTVKS